MPRLEPPTHTQQIALGYCLPACGQMALSQLGISVTQAELAQALGARVGIGTPFSQIKHLQKWNVQVILAQQASVDDLATALNEGKAVIVALTTTPGIPGWGNIRTQHTVLVIDIDAEHVTYHDPALSHGPVSASRAEFLLAWGEMDERTAFLSKIKQT